MPAAAYVDYSKLVCEGWARLELCSPEFVAGTPGHVDAFFVESPITREIYWTGFGFQVWMQMMYHAFRANKNSVLVMDEPDIYLHLTCSDVCTDLCKIGVVS